MSSIKIDTSIYENKVQCPDWMKCTFVECPHYGSHTPVHNCNKKPHKCERDEKIKIKCIKI